MSARAPQLLSVNLVDSATVVGSSELISLPAANVQDLNRKKVWRSDSDSPFVIIANFNDRLDFTEGATPFVALLTPGVYTATGYATEVTAQMNAVGGNTYLVDYGVTVANRFTVDRTAGAAAYSLDWNTGPNAASGTNRSCGIDMGFDVSADDSGFTTYTADANRFKSRQFLKIDLGATPSAATWAIAINTNHVQLNSVEVRRHSSDDPASATVVGILGGTVAFMKLEFASVISRYWWFVYDAISTATIYTETGRLFLGISDTLNQGVWPALRMELIDPSETRFTSEGFAGKNVKEKFWSVGFSLHVMPEADRDILITVYELLGHHESFFINLDPDGTVYNRAELSGLYGFFTNPSASFDFHDSRVAWDSDYIFEEAR